MGRILRSYCRWAAEGEGTAAGWSYGRRINAYRCKLMISSYHYNYKWVVMIILKIVMMIILWCLLLGVVNFVVMSWETCCYLVLWTLWSWVEKLVASWCCELCGRELRNLMLPDHNMMFAARWTTKVRSVDVFWEGPSWGTIAKLLISYCHEMLQKQLAIGFELETTFTTAPLLVVWI